MEIPIMPELLAAPTVAVTVQPEYVPPAEQIICIHPHAETAAHIYEFVANCVNDDAPHCYDALVLVPAPCLTVISKTVRFALGEGWYVAEYRVA